jgi:CheY-like chemotaxis protein/HPt (histidine-containing phosphotransfer) domain-containing protein
VQDTGIGIPADKREQIFGRFTQADASINRQFGGSGLGLAIVKELVERMGGVLGVESTDAAGSPTGGTGSTFWFTLPLKVAEAPSARSVPLPAPAARHYGNRVHVLLVDDNEINQRLAGAMLRNAGCRVTVAGNGQEALDKLQTDGFQLVLMDIQMPVLDGYQATQSIREQLGLTLPVVGLSANVYKEEIDLCYQAGMNDYLSKPYTEQGLREKLARWIATPPAPADVPAGPGGGARKLTNLALLHELYGDESAVRNMVADFLAQQQTLLAGMEAALAAGDYKQLAGLSHHMRSSLEAVGLEALRQPLLTLEALAKGGRAATEVGEALGEIRQLNELAAAELRAGTEPGRSPSAGQ